MAGNYEINNEKFGAFLSRLRKERGMTQKELAEKLFVSDKAVSKWERGLSLPDIALLQPLAEILGVSTTELLSGQYIQEDQKLTVRDVEPLITGALTMTAQEKETQKEHRRNWGKWYFLSLALFAIEVLALWRQLWDELSAFTVLPPLMALIFGAYFVFGAKEKLPTFYDHNKLNFYSDGIFRMNMPGVYFNNSNWPHILNVVRIWACATMGGWVAVYVCVKGLLLSLDVPLMAVFYILMPLTLLEVLGGMMIPVYVVGRKYQ